MPLFDEKARWCIGEMISRSVLQGRLQYGYSNSLARPGANVTGFMAFDFSVGGKWLDLLKEIAPHITRVPVFRDDTNPAGIASFVEQWRPQTVTRVATRLGPLP